MPDHSNNSQAVVMVVDDTASNLELVMDFLEGKDLRVSIARDGTEALNVAWMAPACH